MASNSSEITGWITVKGRRVPIRKGQSKADAVKGNVKRGEGKTRTFYMSSKKGRAYHDSLSEDQEKENAKQMKKEGFHKTSSTKVGIRKAYKGRKKFRIEVKSK